MSSLSGFREAESEWGHKPQAGLALPRVRIPILRPRKPESVFAGSGSFFVHRYNPRPLGCHLQVPYKEIQEEFGIVAKKDFLMQDREGFPFRF